MVTGRRRRAWADTIVNEAISSGGQIIENLLANAPTVDTLTVSRMVGYLEVTPIITSEVEYMQIIDVGIGVVSVDAFAAGAGSLPNPTVETDYPSLGWLYAARRMTWQFKAGNNEQQRHVAVFDFDIGAMRKIDKGRLFMMVSNSQGQGTATAATIIGRIRALCLT